MDSSQKMNDPISTLPREKGWVSENPLYNYQGFWYDEPWIRGAIAAQSDSFLFSPSTTDIILACNPKCGTTWLKALSFAITTRTRYLDALENPLQVKDPHDLIPYLEFSTSSNIKTLDPNLPIIATHLPYTNLPGSILAAGCKIVYIWRDPKDMFVSLWHFFHKVRSNTHNAVAGPIPLEEAFDLFCRGVSSFGPYWDHVLGYLKASLAHPHNILVLKYEDLMSGLVEENVMKLATFIGCPFSVQEQKEGVVAKIVEMCSFETLSGLSVNKGDQLLSKGPISIARGAGFRKGKVGDWKNYLTQEMANQIDRITIDRLGAYGIMPL